MRQTYVRFILSATLLFAIALVSFDFLDGTLYAQTQGQTGTAAQDSQQPTRPQGSPGGVSGSQGSQQAPNERPGYVNQTDNTRAEGTPWGSFVLSFIAGTILGAVLFRRKRPTMIRDRATHDDRDDFRRAA